MEKIIYGEEKNYVLAKVECKDKTEVLTKLGGLLEQKGYVKDTYIQAIIDREAVYPTGLPTGGVAVAIPHTDCIHVNEKAICVGVLEKPVTFTMMGSTDEYVEAGVIFMLAIHDPNLQVPMLQSLIKLCEDGEVLQKLQKLEDEAEICEMIEALL